MKVLLDDGVVWFRLEAEGDRERLTIGSVSEDVKSMISFTLTEAEKQRLREFLL